MFSFSDWFPFDLTWDTLLLFVFTFILVMAGTLTGIIIKELEVFTPSSNGGHFRLWTDENRLFIMLGLAITVGFWAFRVGFAECFVYATMLKTALGTVLNVVFKKRAVLLAMQLARTALANADAKTAAQKDNILAQSIIEAAAKMNIPIPAPAAEVVTDTHPAPARR